MWNLEESPCRDSVQKAKTKLKLRLARDIKRSFYCCISIKRLNKENIGQLMNGVDDLVTADRYG